jgi:polyether ionophore transport system permease protein
VLALVLVLLGPVLNLSHWIVDVSPFTHSPKLPGGQPTGAPLAWLTAVAAALTVAGPACAAATSAEQLSPAQPAPG